MPAWGSLWGLLAGDDIELSRLMRAGDEVGFWDRQPGTAAPLLGPQAAAAIQQQVRAITYRIDEVLGDDRLSGDVDRDVSMIEAGVGLPSVNKSIVVRPLILGQGRRRGALVYGEGLVDKAYTMDSILNPLLTTGQGDLTLGDVVEIARRHILANNVQLQSSLSQTVDAVFEGKAVLLVEGETQALVVEAKAFPTRTVETSQNEPIVRGPQEAFIEDVETNVALIRKRLQDRHLVTQALRVGVRSRSLIVLAYLDDVAAPDLVQEVRRRVQGASHLSMVTSGILQQTIEDAPNSLYPQCLATERPDRVVSFIVEGHVAILVEGDPWALVVPISFWAMLHTSEDSYLRWPYSTFIRTIRLIAMFITTLTPALYVAAITFHQEMIPAPLLISLAAARERVPFPTLVETVLMGFAFELIREAGLRIPSAIGPTIGIVGALILGQAAVQASLVSPAMVIVIAVTGLASFALPNYLLSNALRVSVWVNLLAGATFGFVGISMALFVQLVYLCALKSFGRPYLAPAAPFHGHSRDVMIAFPYWQQEYRPQEIGTQQARRQRPVVRSWQAKGSGGAGHRGTPPQPAARSGRRGGRR